MRYLKQSASRSKDEEAADISLVFKIIHRLNSMYTSRDKISTHLHLVLEEELKKAHRISLRTDHAKALVDFISQIGAILTIAATPHNLKKGFLSNGMIDRGSETYPDFDLILVH